MNKTTMILSAIMMLAMIVLIAPGMIAANRGNMLRNIALWLAIFTGLALIYKNFGPGSPRPLFSLPAGMAAMKQDDTTPQPATEKSGKPDDAKPQDDKGDGSQGFSPPSE